MNYIVIVLLSCISFLCYGTATDELYYFLQNNKFAADFQQITINNGTANKHKSQISYGIIKILRPNKFIWQYNNTQDDRGQTIISDGQKIYLIDHELQQVTYKTINQILNQSPALLLAGNNNIKQFYIIKNLNNYYDINNELLLNNKKLMWLSLTPKSSKKNPKNEFDNHEFKIIYLAFNPINHALQFMQFVDNFNNQTKIIFLNIMQKIQFDKNIFIYHDLLNYDILNNSE